jgi:acyl-[acyl-carrier-protein] desaturase
MAQVSSAIVPEPDSPVDGMCYVAMQELATRISHRNTGTMLNDPVGYNVMMKLSTDENRHHLFYRDLVSKLIELNPSAAIEALKRQITSFSMPGIGIPGFVEHAKAIAQVGIYDFAIHQEKIIMPLVFRQWAIDKVEGLSSAAEEARDAMFKYIDRVGKVARRQVERREASEAAAIAIL